MVPARLRALRRRSDRRARVRLDHHGGRPPAMDRLQRPAHGRRRHAGRRRLGHLLARARDLRRARRDAGDHAPGDVAALARARRRPRRGALRPGHRTTPDRGGPGMTLANAVAVVLVVGVTMYAVFGGADFGAGLWSLLAGSD